jgi:hypothetical protein
MRLPNLAQRPKKPATERTSQRRGRSDSAVQIQDDTGCGGASYLRKTIEEFASSIIGYEKVFSAADVDKKLTFAFVTNADFSPELWEAIKGAKG